MPVLQMRCLVFTAMVQTDRERFLESPLTVASANWRRRMEHTDELAEVRMHPGAAEQAVIELAFT